MANPAPAPTPGATDPSVQSSMSVGDRRAKARVAVVSRAAGSEVSEDPVSEPMTIMFYLFLVTIITELIFY